MTKPHSREIYRDSTPFGDEVWLEIEHPDVPEGWALRQTTTLTLRCIRCDRMTYGLSHTTLVDLQKLECEHCD